WDIALSAEPGLHQRGVAAALMSYRGVQFALAGTHLDLRSEPRVRHVAEIEEALAAVLPGGTPVIVAGDMNDTPGSPVWSALTAHRVDAAAAVSTEPAVTFSAQSPRRRIDGIFVDPRFSVRSVQVIESADVLVGSDHRPVVADLEFDAS
ncbi:MAG: Endonuclease/exonuclease/phosphatase, partial [Jatrophihabitantaceae bacterium]|nr:Endonuclease/exonuclease/phosphatase [Jatrophihabitantaceae bacterium]